MHLILYKSYSGYDKNMMSDFVFVAEPCTIEPTETTGLRTPVRNRIEISKSRDTGRSMTTPWKSAGNQVVVEK